MRYGHSRVLVEEELRYRKAYDVASAYYHGTLALDLDSSHLEHLDYTLRCAWQGAFLLLPEGRDIERMESVNILLLGYRCDDLVLADVFRKRKLHEDAVYRIVSVKFLYDAEELSLRYGVRLADGRIPDADILRCLCLACNI